MGRRISKIIYDYCFKLYTLLCYINLKICILFGFDLKFYFSNIYFFVKKKTGWGVSHVLPCLKNNIWLLLKTFSETIYDYCIRLPHKMSGVTCAHGAAVYCIL